MESARSLRRRGRGRGVRRREYLFVGLVSLVQVERDEVGDGRELRCG
jgi:hypothetical protein